MREIQLSADNLVLALLNLHSERNLCLLDSCNISHFGSRFLIAGFDPVEVLEINETDAGKTLEIIERKGAPENRAAIFTVSYDLGLKLEKIEPRPKEFSAFAEPDVFLALFDVLIFHDYRMGKTFLQGDEKRFFEIEKILLDSFQTADFKTSVSHRPPTVVSNFTRESYISAVEEIQEMIRAGETYQTNLTQQIRARLPEELAPERIFLCLRENHPAPFAAFLRRGETTVVSASPERFLKVEDEQSPIANRQSHIIRVSPIKGTRPRGKTSEEDEKLRLELLGSAKDRAENVMIVDLLRNDIGRICEYGSVRVERLCDLATHPSLFHLVSTVSGRLREEINFGDILRAVFPCGSITGAPKIRTMRIIDRLETAPRGLSMGAIGYVGFDKTVDSSVAIRTMVIKEREAIFNVGGGIVIDSSPAEEYEETLVKAKALLAALGASVEDLGS